MAAKPPLLVLLHQHPPSPSHAPCSSVVIHPSTTTPPSSSKSPIDYFSPPLIAMVVVAAAAFLFITYSRLISRHLSPPFLRLLRRRQTFPPSSDFGSPSSPNYQSYSDHGFYVYSPYGLDESTIKNIPLTLYNNKQQQQLGYTELDNNKGFHDCAVCLLDFQEGDCIRTLPHCFHPFHVDCIDMWLRSHATCPLCRSGVFLSDSPVLLSPLMAARIRPSFDHLESIFFEPLQEVVVVGHGEIQEEEEEQEVVLGFSPGVIQSSEDHRSNRRELDCLLKRSYSFGFERRSSYPSSDRLAATTPYHHHRTKRPSSTPYKPRLFSFRRTPAFFRRRGWESSTTRIRTTSRMRLGDPEALISPERYNRR